MDNALVQEITALIADSSPAAIQYRRALRALAEAVSQLQGIDAEDGMHSDYTTILQILKGEDA